jgi:hypothetical protein
MLPADNRPSAVFKRLFVDGTAGEVAEQARRLREGRSIMDLMGEESRRLRRGAGARDGRRLDEYFTTVREVEQRLHESQQVGRADPSRGSPPGRRRTSPAPPTSPGRPG